jgi:nitronate monooxygenase
MGAMRTPLCDLLNIDYPLLQSGMRRVAGPELVAEVSRAGALGILAGLAQSGDELRGQIRRVRELTARPFGVNLWLHEEILPSRPPLPPPDETVGQVQQVLNQFRQQLGLPPTGARPPAFPDLIAEELDVIIEERVPLFSIGLGNPEPALVERCHRAGILVMAMVTSLADALLVAEAGVDIIAAQGSEAGGHRSTWTKPSASKAAGVGTMALVPQIVDAIDRPVVAAGGIADGRGVVAALALGAQGALLGTRFVATRESIAPQMYKDAVLAASSDDTRITEAFTGLPARVLKNAFVEEYDASGAPVLPGLRQSRAAEDIVTAAAKAGNRNYFPLMAGQSAGLVGNLPSSSDVVAAIVSDARAALSKLRALS